MSKILVTGGAGFIGSHVTEELLSRGHAVRVLDDLSTGLREQVPEAAEFLAGSILEASDLREAMRGVDAVVHLAALIDVGESAREPDRYREVNVGGTLQVLEAARSAGVRRFVFASSAAVYGAASGAIDEQAPLRPTNVYGETKLDGEVLLFGPRYQGLAPVALRFFNVYGPRQRADLGGAGVVARFLRALGEGRALPMRGDGSQTRDFVHVADLANVVANAVERDEVAHLAVNVGSGRQTSVLELAERLAREVGAKLEVTWQPSLPGEVAHSRANPGLAERALSLSVRALADGLRDTVASKSAGAMRVAA